MATNANYISPTRHLSAQKGLLYLLIGGGIGAVTALLFAPKSGSELRGNIGELAQKGIDKGIELKDTVKAKTEELAEAARGKGGRVLDLASSRLASAEAEVVKAEDEILSLEPAPVAETKPPSGRRSSSIL